MPIAQNYLGLTTDKLLALPLVIAGPIVRKVTQNEVSIWFVLKHPKDVYVQLFEPSSQVSRGIGMAETIPIGELLHLALITVPITTVLTSGNKYAYNVYFVENGASGPSSTNNLSHNIATFDDLWTNGIIYEKNKDNKDPLTDFANILTYPGESYPTFFVPSNSPDNLTVAHASCRKPHGGEDYNDNKDALSLLDTTIEKWRTGEKFEFMKTDSTEPQVLFLTGDQIYADDVHPRLLFMIRTSLNTLLGYNYLDDVEKSFVNDPDLNIKRSDFTCNKRSSLVYREANYTSGHPKAHYGLNQLIHAPEFFMMYIFAWSDVLWPTDAEINDITSYKGELSNGHVEYVEDNIPYYYSTDNDKSIDIKSLRNLKSFRGTLPKVRRLLANISTYMMFDDHDVTDDFLLNYNWSKSVLDTKMGRYITTGGLTAFALFQSWGNNPSYYNSGVGKQLLDKVPLWLNRNTVFSSTPLGAELDIQQLVLPVLVKDDSPYGSELEGFRLSGQMDWHVNIDFGNYQVIIIDPRTKRWFRAPNRQREQIQKDHENLFPSGSGLFLLNDYPGYDPAALLSEHAMNRQIPKQSSSKFTILVSPAPIVGLNSVESGQWHGIYGAGLFDEQLYGINNLNDRWTKDKEYEIGFSKLDAEAWVFNQYAWDRLLYQLLEHENVIVLSGDVHYGFTNYTKMFDYSSPNNPYRTNVTKNDDQKPLGAEKVLRMLQCTASSAKNETSGTHSMNMGFWLWGNDMRTMLTDSRDDERTFRIPFSFDLDKPIHDTNFATDNIRFQYFVDTYWNDILMNDFYCKTYPTRITETQYIKDKRWREKRLEKPTKGVKNVNNRWAVGHNNFGLVNIKWDASFNIVKHILVFPRTFVSKGAEHMEICNTRHLVNFNDTINNPYKEP